MALTVNTNLAALSAYRSLSVTDRLTTSSLEKLSSGNRINRAADDAAGLAISEGLRAKVGGLKVALRNTLDGSSVAQTAAGALAETHGLLRRMRDLSVQAANAGGMTEATRGTLHAELAALSTELDRIATTTSWNGTTLLDGTYSATFQVGANAGETLSIRIGAPVSAAGLGLGTIDLRSAPAAAIPPIDAAIATVSAVRADLGAAQNRFEHTVRNLGAAVENLSASESRIRDSDMALEMVRYTRNQILSESGTVMISRAGQAAQGVLALLR
jgi:flagellin